MAPIRFTRRQLLVGGAVGLTGTALLGACGGKAKQLNVLTVTPPTAPGVDSRIAFVLRDDQAFLKPAKVRVRFGSGPDHFDGPTVDGVVHTDTGTAPAYVTLATRFDRAGSTFLQVTADGAVGVGLVEVVDTPTGIQPGQPMPSIQSPTTTDLQGVELLCTRDPVCPLHDVTVAAAVADKRPFAVLVATPAYCQTAVCGPVLDLLLDARPKLAGLRLIHLEVYSKKPDHIPDDTLVTPSVTALGLQSEPVLLTVGGDGLVKARLDGLYGTSEAVAVLSPLT